MDRSLLKGAVPGFPADFTHLLSNERSFKLPPGNRRESCRVGQKYSWRCTGIDTDTDMVGDRDKNRDRDWDRYRDMDTDTDKDTPTDTNTDVNTDKN
jgi:hypothetical protein